MIDRFLGGITELLQSLPYTLDMPKNPAAHEYIEKRFARADIQPLTGYDNFRFEHGEYTTLIGQKGSGKGPRVALVFHYDIAPDEADWVMHDKHTPELMTKKQFAPYMDPEQVHLAGEQLIIGKGVADMLGAAEAILQTAELIPDDLPGICLFIATPDEERGSAHGMIPLLNRLSREHILPDIMIGAESTFMDVLVRRRGGYAFDITLKTQTQELFPYRYTIKTQGKNMHPGIFTFEKREAHANLQMARVLTEIGEHQVLNMQGGHIVNVIPQECRAEIATQHPIDFLQINTPHTVIKEHKLFGESGEVIIGMAQALEAIGAFTIEVEAQSDFGISCGPHFIENAQVKVSLRVMQGNTEAIVDQLSKQLFDAGLSDFAIDIVYEMKPFFSDPTHPAIIFAKNQLQQAGWLAIGNRENYGTSDINFLYDYPSIIGFEIGPVGANEHGANEWVCAQSLLALPKIYAECVKRIAHQ